MAKDAAMWRVPAWLPTNDPPERPEGRGWATRRPLTGNRRMPCCGVVQGAIWNGLTRQYWCPECGAIHDRGPRGTPNLFRVNVE